MSGLFDGYRVSVSGLDVHRALMDVVGNNISHASDKNYTRQEAVVSSNGSLRDAQNRIFGAGVKIDSIQRIRDELLDKQLRNTSASSSNYATQLSWMNKIENIFNDPSENGLNASIADYWNAWSQLSSSPEDFSTRSNLMTKTERLTNLIQTTHEKLTSLQNESEDQISSIVTSINDATARIAQLNKSIFETEAGQSHKANDLRDQRDAALDSLAEFADISYREDPNGMMSVFIQSHPAVINDKSEDIVVENDPDDTSKVKLMWAYGEAVTTPDQGSLSGIYKTRDETIPSYIDDINEVARLLIQKTNEIYSLGTPLEPFQNLSSTLGITSLGVTSPNQSLHLLKEGETGTISVSFFKDGDSFSKTQSVVIHSTDTMQDIINKLDSIDGLSASLLSSPDPQYDGRLSLKLENGSPYSGFTVAKESDDDTTSSFVNLLSFNTSQKSKDNPPSLLSGSLQDLATKLNVSIGNLATTPLNLKGHFSLNAFETVTPENNNQSGHQILQIGVDVDSSDSLQDIVDKINNASSSTGFVANLDFTNDYLSISSNLMTDDSGNISSSGSHSVAISFSNQYFPQTYSNDNPPDLFNGKGDEIGLFSQMQFNSFFQGKDASDIQLNKFITSSAMIHSGYELGSGNNDLAMDMLALQQTNVSTDNLYTIDQKYQNIISKVGNQTNQTDQLATNEKLMLEGFTSEKDSISGVNLDEELAKMLLYQRGYQACARFLSSLDDMAQEFLRGV